MVWRAPLLGKVGFSLLWGLSGLDQRKASLLRRRNCGPPGHMSPLPSTLLPHDPCWLSWSPCSSSFWVKGRALPGTSSGMLTQDRNDEHYFTKGSGGYQLTDAPAHIPRLYDRVCATSCCGCCLSSSKAALRSLPHPSYIPGTWAPQNSLLALMNYSLCVVKALTGEL